MFRNAPFLVLFALLAGGCAIAPTASEAFVIVSVEGQSKDGHHDYEAYVSAPFNSTDAVPGSVDLGSSQINLDGPGWAYMWGAYPVAKGKRVRVVGTGTRVILETTPTADRVYFIPQLGDHALTLYDDAGNQLLQTGTFVEEQFVEFDDLGTPPTVRFIRDVQSADNFVREVRRRVSSYDWPMFWPSW